MATHLWASRGRWVLVLVALLALATICGRVQPAAAAGAQLYVSPTGTDAGDGTQQNPVRTIGRALQLATAGDTVQVAAGTYPPFRTNRLFREPVTVAGEGGGASIVEGDSTLQSDGSIEFWGAAGVVLEGLTVRGGRVYITDERNHALERGSAGITLREDELVGKDGLGAGVTIRSGSENIAIEDCYIHDLGSGITGPNYRITDGVDSGLALVKGVTIRNNRIERLKEDALQFADWEQVVIEGNVMRDAEHDPPPAPQYHNDLIQFTGYSFDVRIADNYLAESAQEIFIQPAFGPIDDVLVENNVLLDARSYAVQSQAVTHLRFVQNTLWHSNYGMIVREGPHGEPAATDGIIVGNIFDKLAYPAGTTETHNLIATPQRAAGYGTDDLLRVDPGFVAPEAGDLHLAEGSAAIGAGDSLYAPATDLDGRRRQAPPALGAYEGPTSPGPETTEPPNEPEPEPNEPEPDEPAPESSEPEPEPEPGEPAPELPEPEPEGEAEAPQHDPDPLGDKPATPGPEGGDGAAQRSDGGAAARAAGAPSPSEEGAEGPAAPQASHLVQIELRLSGGRTLFTTARLKPPAFCHSRCTVAAGGRILLRGLGPRASAVLRPRRDNLSTVLHSGLRLSAPRRIAVSPHRGPVAVARLRLRFVGEGRQASSSLRVRFTHPVLLRARER